jgi:hypothetical protein
MGWGGGGDLRVIPFHRQETKTKAKMSRTCSSILITTRTSSSSVNAFVSWRWVARVASGSERVTRQTRAGREVKFFSDRCDVPRDGNSGEDVVRFHRPHLHLVFTSVSRHILRSPRVPASSAAATRARRETPCNITRHAPRDGTRLEDAHFINLMHLQGTCKFRLSARL